MAAGVLVVGVTAFSVDLLVALATAFLTTLAGASAGFSTAVGVAPGDAVVGVTAKALIEIRPATRVAISLLISWTFQLFVKSSKRFGVSLQRNPKKAC